MTPPGSSVEGHNNNDNDDSTLPLPLIGGEQAPIDR